MYAKKLSAKTHIHKHTRTLGIAYNDEALYHIEMSVLPCVAHTVRDFRDSNIYCA